ncbi:MAG: hydrogenase iron-sulfur subunit [Sedimentisphaerales bacterium]
MFEENKFEPKIIGFLCNWCSYVAADLAGTSRMRYPANLIPVRVMCTSAVSPHYILKAFQKGADGVLIAGCHLGSCHYLKGNYLTLKRTAVVKEMLDFIGLSSERLRLEWISADEATKFTQIVTEFTNRLRTIGPSPLSE